MTLNMVYRLLGQMALAEHHCTRALACYDQLHNRRGLANAYLGLVSIRQAQGLLSEAEALFTQSRTLSRDPILLHRLQAYALADLGELCVDQGHYDRALSLAEEALALTPGDALICNTALSTLARSYLLLGDGETARLMLSRMILPGARAERMGKYHAVHDLTEGLILLFEQRTASACALLKQTELVLKTTGMRLQQLQANLLLAACHLEQGQVPEMLRRLEEVATMLSTYECYARRVPIELRHLPALAQAIQMLPEAAQVRALLQMERQEQVRDEVVASSALPASVPAQVVASDGPPRLRILAFGEPVVLLEEQPMVGWRMARALELFFYLLDAGRPVRKEQIITALWPEANEQVDHTFHNTIYYVRKAIGEACLVLAHNAYTLELTSCYGKQVCYDVARFEACSARAREALARKDDAAAAPALEEMIELYRGDYLLPLYSDWCSVRRESLRMAYLDALLYLAQLAWRSEAFEKCVEHWQRIVTIDPLREEAHAGLIRCYLRQGKRGLALRQYTRCREALQQELGIEPGPSLQRLYQYLSSAR